MDSANYTFGENPTYFAAKPHLLLLSCARWTNGLELYFNLSVLYKRWTRDGGLRWTHIVVNIGFLVVLGTTYNEAKETQAQWLSKQKSLAQIEAAKRRAENKGLIEYLISALFPYMHWTTVLQMNKVSGNETKLQIVPYPVRS